MARSNNNLKAVLQDTADAIRTKKGTSEAICPRDFADEIGSIQSGGAQPTLFAPIITVSGNTVTWERDTRNGGFGDTLAANIDEEVVTQPLTITPELDAKELVVKSLALNFEDGVATKVLEYATVIPVTKKIVIEINSIQTDASYPYLYLLMQMYGGFGVIYGNAKVVYNGVEYPLDTNTGPAFKIPIDLRVGRQEIDIYFEKNITPNPSSQPSLWTFLRRSPEPITAGYGGVLTYADSYIKGDIYGFIDDGQVSHEENTNGCRVDMGLGKEVITYCFFMSKC